MSDNGISRVHYFERQFLRTEDFDDEQAYHLAMRRRHNVGHHTWGIVRGLELIKDQDGNMFVAAGMAVDGYGRELILPENQPLSQQAFDEKHSDRLDVWLMYDLLEGGQASRSICDADGTVGAHNRTRELPEIRLEPPETDLGGAESFDPSRTPPDDPWQAWPVLLGQILRSRSKPGEPYSYEISLDGRPYAGLVGERIVHPTRLAWIDLQAPVEGAPGRFAVVFQEPGSEEALTPLVIDSEDQGHIDLWGEATLHGDLTIDGGVVSFEPRLDAEKLAAENAGPCRIYCVTEPYIAPQEPQPDDPPPKEGDKGERPDTAYTQELQVQAPGETPDGDAAPVPEIEFSREFRLQVEDDPTALDQVVIGSWRKARDPSGAEQEAFFPCLTVEVEKKPSVTVHGNLIVEGSIEGLRIPPEQDPAVKAHEIQRQIENTSRAIENLPSALREPYGVSTSALSRMLDETTGRQIVLDLLTSNEDRLRNFIEALIEIQRAREIIVELLPEEIVAALEADPTELITLLGAHPDLLKSVLEKLIEVPEFFAAAIEVFEGSPEAREQFAEQLAVSAHPDRILRALMDEPTLEAARVDVLMAANSRREEVIKALLNDDAGRPQMVAEILGSEDGRLALITALTGHGFWMEVVAEAMLANLGGIPVLIAFLLASDKYKDVAAGLALGPG